MHEMRIDGTTYERLRRWARRPLVPAAAALTLAACAAPAAHADAFGQLATWGEPGTDLDQFAAPMAIGVDPVDDSSYVLDLDAISSASFRLVKFDGSGHVVASTTFPLETDAAGNYCF